MKSETPSREIDKGELIFQQHKCYTKLLWIEFQSTCSCTHLQAPNGCLNPLAIALQHQTQPNEASSLSYMRQSYDDGCKYGWYHGIHPLGTPNTWVMDKFHSFLDLAVDEEYGEPTSVCDLMHSHLLRRSLGFRVSMDIY